MLFSEWKNENTKEKEDTIKPQERNAVKGTAAAPRIVTLISVTWIHLFIHIGMI
jgi:hypothetical protein